MTSASDPSSFDTTTPQSVPSLESTTETFDLCIERAKVLTAKEDWEGAIAQYEEALTIRPDTYAWLYLAVGPLLIKRGRTDEAIQCYRKANALSPNSARPYALMGIALEKKQLYSEAIISCRKALSLGLPQPAWVHTVLANLLTKRAQKDYWQSIVSYLKAMLLQDKFHGFVHLQESLEKVYGSTGNHLEHHIQELGKECEEHSQTVSLARLQKLGFLNTANSPVNPAGYYFINETLKVIYCGIPKNACTLFKTMLVEHSSDWEKFYASSENIHHYLNRQARDTKVSHLLSCLVSEEYFKFVVLRNPFDRAVSAYLDKFAKHSVPETFAQDVIQSVHHFLGQPFDLQRGITFSQFVDYLVRTPDKALNDHWRPQHNFTAGVDFDFVGQFEDINSVISLVENKLGISVRTEVSNHVTQYQNFADTLNFQDMFPHELRALGGMPKASVLYTKELKCKIRSRFNQDVILFENSFGPIP